MEKITIDDVLENLNALYEEEKKEEKKEEKDDKEDDEDEDVGGGVDGDDEDAGAKYSYYSSIGSVLQIERHKASTQTLLGYPSPDSRGPEISISSSIGISACAPSVVADGVWEFIKFCLSDDIQDMIARSGYNPVSISVYESTARIAFESCNKLIIKENNWLNRSMPLVDESVIESYKKILLSGSVIENTDPAIIVVLREEMPPYFVDQKSLDEIIPIIKNRVTTILSERAS